MTKIFRIFLSFVMVLSSIQSTWSEDSIDIKIPAVFDLNGVDLGIGPPGPSGPNPFHSVNMANHSQTRWTDLMLPTALADALPDECIYLHDSGQSRAYKGRKYGMVGQVFHVLISLPGWSTGSGKLQAGTPNSEEFQMSDWFTDNPAGPVMTLDVVRGGKRTSIPFQFLKTVSSNKVCRMDKFRAGLNGGVWSELYVKYYTNQPVADFELRWGWHDYNDPLWCTWFDSVEIMAHDEIWLDWAHRQNFRKVTGGQQVYSSEGDYLRGQFPHGAALFVKGSLLAKSDKSETANPPDKEERENLIAAARLGRIYITGGKDVWDGRWIAFGVAPEIPRSLDIRQELDNSASRFRSFMGGTGKLWETRPLGHITNTGGTGAQPPFGATKGTRAVSAGDPRWLDEGGYSMTGLGIRHISYRMPDGSAFDPDDPRGTDSVWYDGGMDPRLCRTPAGLLGKSTQVTPGFNRGFGGPDDQHAGFNAEAAAAVLLGSPLAQDWFTDLVRDHYTWRGPRWDTTAARSLRAQQDIAYGARLADNETDRQRALKVLEWGLQTWEPHLSSENKYMGWTGGNVTGPVKPFSAGGPDVRVLCCGNMFWVPWNEAQGALGWWHARNVWRDIGRMDMVARYDAILTNQISTILKYGAIRNNSSQLMPINGVRWLPNGEANPPNYYEFNRSGVGTQGEVDLLLGELAWFRWWGPAIKGGLLFFPPSSTEYQIADEIMRANPPSTIEDAEWLALDK